MAARQVSDVLDGVWKLLEERYQRHVDELKGRNIVWLDLQRGRRQELWVDGEQAREREFSCRECEDTGLVSVALEDAGRVGLLCECKANKQWSDGDGGFIAESYEAVFGVSPSQRVQQERPRYEAREQSQAQLSMMAAPTAAPEQEARNAG